MRSVLQYHAQNGTTKGRFFFEYPCYRERFADLDKVFGRERVTLRPFGPEHLEGNNVVRDFGLMAGIELSAEEIRSANEGLSLEAFALLYVAMQQGGADGKVEIRKLASWLQSFGFRKLRLAPSLVNGVLQATVADRTWMEERLGTALPDESTEGTIPVSNECELNAFAREIRGEFLAWAGRREESGMELGSLVLRAYEQSNFR